MASKRMFSKSIVMSDVFLDLPVSARCLYFTLGIVADDDGFIGNPKSIIRLCGLSQDDLETLIQKRYVLRFESGVVVIKHWFMNNYIRNDRHHSTTYLEEMDAITLDERGAYTEKPEFKGNYEFGIPLGRQVVATLDTEIRLDKVRLDNNTRARAKTKKSKTMHDNNRNYTSEEFKEMERDALRRG